MFKNSAPNHFIWAHIFKKAPTSEGGCAPLRSWSLKMGRGFEARVAHPVQLKSEYPPGLKWHKIMFVA